MDAMDGGAVPSLSELCARAMLESPGLSVETKLAVLDRLKNLSKARSDALEREVEEWAHSRIRSKALKAAPKRRHREQKSSSAKSVGERNFVDGSKDAVDLDQNLTTRSEARWGAKLDNRQESKSSPNEGNQNVQSARPERSNSKATKITRKSRGTRPESDRDETEREKKLQDAEHVDQDDAREVLAQADAQADREEALKYKLASEAAKRRRKALQEVFEWKQRYTKLVHQVQVIDRERQAILRMARSELEDEAAELAKYEVERERKTHEMARDISNQLDKARWAVGRMASTVAEMGSGDAYLQAVEQQMDQAESLISGFKVSQREAFDKLVEKEAVLTQEIEHLASRFELEQDQDRASKRLAAQEKRKITPRGDSSVPESRSPLSAALRSPHGPKLKSRIDAIDLEIADRGGSTGHWDSRDHTEFLRFVSRLKVPEASLVQFSQHKDGANSKVQDKGSSNITDKSISRLIDKAGLELPGKDETAVREHVYWYGHYLRLLAEKKRVVREWKASKGAGRLGLVNKEQTNPNANNPKSACQGSPHSKTPEEVIVERKERERLQRREREDKRRAVEEWKAARRAEKRKEIAAKEAEERALREQRANEIQRRRDEKEQIAIFKLQREAERDRQKRLQESAEQDARQHELQLASLSLKERQARDLAIATQRRMINKHKRESENLDRASQIQSLKVKPAVRPGFEQKLKTHSALTETTAAYNLKKLTPEELGELQERRASTRAHDMAVPSSAAAALGGRSYAIGVKNLVGGRASASWRAS